MSLHKKFQHLKIDLRAIQFATNNFSRDNRIGEGGFGKVYKGKLIHSEGDTTVALKVLDRKFGQGDPEFWKEVMFLSHYRHTNVAALLGFCDEGAEKILVYEYAAHYSLDKYIGSELRWVQRLNICIGAARGLAYLHNPDNSKQRVLHRDIKSSNILLDENWKAMIADFGLSKIGPANQEDTFLVSQVVGTYGYCDPNYMATGLLTKESDVYSFGVVLFEVICGKLCTSNSKTFNLTRQAREYYEQKKMKDIVLGYIKDEINPDSMNVFATIAYQCTHDDYERRPLMTDVVSHLENALQYQENKTVICMGELLSVRPQEIYFPFELMKEISATMQLHNRTYSHVAYKVKSTRPVTYAADPRVGILPPQSTCQIKLTMQPQKEDPSHDKRCNVKYLVESAVVSKGVTKEDITREMFNKETGNQVGECRVDVSFVAPKLSMLPSIKVPSGPLSNSNTVSAKNSFSDHIQNSKDARMGELLSIEPDELQFQFELMKEISITLKLKNKTNTHVAFKVKTTKPEKYAAQPTTAIVLPHSTYDVIFTMQPQEEAPRDMKCTDKYLLLSAVVSPGFLSKDIASNLFKKEPGNKVEQCILNVKYVSPNQPSSSSSSVSQARKKSFGKSGNLRHLRDDYNIEEFQSI